MSKMMSEEILGSTIDIEFSDSGADELYSVNGLNRPLAEFIIAYMQMVFSGNEKDDFASNNGNLYGVICGETFLISTDALSTEDCLEIIQKYSAKPYDVCTMQSRSYTAGLSLMLNTESGDFSGYTAAARRYNTSVEHSLWAPLDVTQSLTRYRHAVNSHLSSSCRKFIHFNYYHPSMLKTEGKLRIVGEYLHLCEDGNLHDKKNDLGIPLYNIRVTRMLSMDDILNIIE